MTYRTKLALRALPAVLLAAPALSATPALAAPVAVTLRVEGASKTTYENRVTTDGHTVTTASGGTHKCDGTNGGVHPTPGPTATAALDDAAKLGDFTWDGSYNDGFDDYFVSRVGPDSQTDTQFWGFAVNWQFPDTGGCQTRVKQGDEVLWVFDGFGKPLLRLDGPTTADTGQNVSVRVTDGQDGSPETGVSVGGKLTGPDGRASLSFDDAGIYRLKAERTGSVRSNALVLCIDPPEAEPCTSSDRTPPSVDLMLPGDYASESSRSRTILVSWQGDDRSDGTGITSYGLDVREVAAGVDTAADEWRTLVDRTTITKAHFRGASGHAYRFRVRAFDRAANVGSAESDTMVIPVDDRDRRLLRFSRGWRRLRRSGAWGRYVVRSRRVGARARLRFRGGRVAIIGRKLPRGGRLRVTVAGRTRTILVRGRPRHRSVLFLSRRLRSGAHTVRVRAAGDGPVEIDAVAPIP